MTAPNRPRLTESDNVFESMSNWFNVYNKQITYGVIAIAVIIGGLWFYNRSRSLKSERAEKAYFTAMQDLPGNQPLAESDLRKVTTRYAGTTGAMQATLTLAQVLYDQGKFQQGIDALKQAEGSLGKSKDFAAQGYLLLAAGYEQLRKFDDAANAYAAAVKSARFEDDRQRYTAAMAQAYFLAGKKDEAKKIWTQLAADSKNVVAGEARERLGELTAAPQPKS